MALRNFEVARRGVVDRGWELLACLGSRTGSFLPTCCRLRASATAVIDSKPVAIVSHRILRLGCEQLVVLVRSAMSESREMKSGRLFWSGCPKKKKFSTARRIEISAQQPRAAGMYSRRSAMVAMHLNLIPFPLAQVIIRVLASVWSDRTHCRDSFPSRWDFPLHVVIHVGTCKM